MSGEPRTYDPRSVEIRITGVPDELMAIFEGRASLSGPTFHRNEPREELSRALFDTSISLTRAGYTHQEITAALQRLVKRMVAAKKPKKKRKPRPQPRTRIEALEW